MILEIDNDILIKEDIIPELFYLFFEEEKECLESKFFSQDINENFTHFCIKEWKEFDHAFFKK
jgi:hypothetical protein